MANSQPLSELPFSLEAFTLGLNPNTTALSVMKWRTVRPYADRDRAVASAKTHIKQQDKAAKLVNYRVVERATGKVTDEFSWSADNPNATNIHTAHT